MLKVASITYEDYEDYNDEKPYVCITLKNKRKIYIGKSNILGEDNEKIKSSAIWIPYWYAVSRGLSTKKVGWYNEETSNIQPRIEIEKHIPEKIKPKEIKIDESLRK